MRFQEQFFKLSGSGNDFVAFDRMGAPSPDGPDWLTASAIRALCRRGEGVGADGVMVLQRAAEVDYQLLYFNADGGRSELCGNASLCSIRLAVELGHASPGGVRFRTDAGLITGRISQGVPELDLAPVAEVDADRPDLEAERPDGRRLGFARVGVPHVVILCDDADGVPLLERAPRLRHHPALRDGANVNFVSPAGERWRIRTFERGVEAETLACGTGSVATALLLERWREAGLAGHVRGESDSATTDSANPASTVELITSSGRLHRVRLRRDEQGRVHPSLAGSARIVFQGSLGEGDW